MLNTTAEFEQIIEPFQISIADYALEPDQVAALYRTRPTHGYRRIVRLDPNHEKQYAMNLLYLQQRGHDAAAVKTLSPEWIALIRDLQSAKFISWLEQGTHINLTGLYTDIGIYTHQSGDYISVHKDKANKALTAILYLNDIWPPENGGNYEVRISPDPRVEPIQTIPPTGGRFLAFPPTDRSWHSVSPITADGALRLTVQLEFWL